MDLHKDYDITISYHRSKANVVANALSRKHPSIGSLACSNAMRRLLDIKVQTLAKSFIRLQISGKGGVFAFLEVRSSFPEQIKVRQFEYVKLSKIHNKVYRERPNHL